MSIATLPQATKVLELIGQKKISSEQLQRLLEGGFISDLLDANGKLERDSFRKFLGLGSLMPEITELSGIVLPDLSEGLDTRIKKGEYGWKNDSITLERFPLTLPAGPRDLVLAWFNKDMTSEKVEQWAAENGYEVALIDDLLAVGSHSEYRDLQLKFPIIALGSSAVLCGGRSVPYLGRYGAERKLDLNWYDDGWRPHCRFLLRKVSQPSVT